MVMHHEMYHSGDNGGIQRRIQGDNGGIQGDNGGDPRIQRRDPREDPRRGSNIC